MARYKLVAHSNAVAGREADFERWYESRHMPDMLAVPGFISAERFTAVGESPYQFLAIYEIESDDIFGTLAEIGKRAGTDAMPINDAIDTSQVSVVTWQPVAAG